MLEVMISRMGCPCTRNGRPVWASQAGIDANKSCSSYKQVKLSATERKGTEEQRKRESGTHPRLLLNNPPPHLLLSQQPPRIPRAPPKQSRSISSSSRQLLLLFAYVEVLADVCEEVPLEAAFFFEAEDLLFVLGEEVFCVFV